MKPIDCAWCGTPPRVLPMVAERHVGGVACDAIQKGRECEFCVGLNGYTIPVPPWNEIMALRAGTVADKTERKQ